MRYRPDIDGLRAVAVLPVLLFHAHIPGFEGGFVGVDVFFVISGYLICSILGRELSAGEFSLVRFYERRCRRLAPALLAMVAASAAAAALFMVPPDLAAFGRSVWAAILFFSNWFFWKESGYFDGQAELKPLLHTWSLAVEEQFYLFVPLLLAAIARWGKGRYGRALLPLVALSLGLSQWAVARAPNAAFYLLPSRFWEILLGGWLSLALPEGSSKRGVRELCTLGGLSLIGGSVFTYSETTVFPGLAALLPCLGAAAVLYGGQSGSSYGARLLGAWLPRTVGKISYSLYLWHWPVLVFYHYRLAQPATGLEAVGLLVAIFVLATLSWRYVEQPFRREAMSQRRLFLSTGAFAGAILGGAWVAVACQGLPGRMPDFHLVEIPGQEHYDASEQDRCFLDTGASASDWGAESCYVTRGQGPTVLLWGDSFAAHYVPGLRAHAARLRADILQYTLSACPPVLEFDSASNPACLPFNERVPELVRQFDVKGVVVSGRWDYAIRRHVESAQIRRTLERLVALGVRVDVLGPSPVFGISVQTLFAQGGQGPTSQEARAPVATATRLLSVLEQAMPAGAQLVQPWAYWCNARGCLYRHEGQFLMFDEGHFSVTGSELAVASYFPYLEH